MNNNFSDTSIQLKDRNMIIKVISVKSGSVCKSRGSVTKVYEAFMDNSKTEARRAGQIFCASLNGKLSKFPETTEELSLQIEYKTKLMESKNIQSITTPLSAKSISVLPLKPNVGIPPNGFLDIIDVQTESRINPVENIQKLIT